MFGYPEFNENGIKTLCEMKGEHADMGMNIYVIKMKAGQVLTYNEEKNETAVLLLEGHVKFTQDRKSMEGTRANPFEKKPYAIHCPAGMQFTVEAIEDSEVIVEQTDNDKVFDSHFYNPDNCLYQEFGKGQWNGAGHRIVSTMFDIDNAPYSNLVLGEVFTQPGRWSSYPPHHHPQPEVYYYKFDKPQGFGACFLGDNVYKSTDGSVAFIEPGDDHEQAAAPGYEMYYVWMIRHIDGDPWYKTTRIIGDEHKWLVDAD